MRNVVQFRCAHSALTHNEPPRTEYSAPHLNWDSSGTTRQNMQMLLQIKFSKAKGHRWLMLVLLQVVLFCGTFSPFVEPFVRLHLQNVWLVVAVSESDSAQIMNTSCKLAPACMTEPCVVFTMTAPAIIWQSLSGMLCLLVHRKSPNQLITFIGRASWFWPVTIVQLFP